MILQEADRQIVYTDRDIDLAVNTLMECTLIANDIETIPFKKQRKIRLPFTMTINCYTGYHQGKLYSYCFPFQTSKSITSETPSNLANIYNACKIINDSGIPFTGQNYVYDLIWHLRYGLPVRNWKYDSMIMFWSIWPELPKTLDFIASILNDNYQYWKANRKKENFDEYCEYGMDDTHQTMISTIRLIDMLSQDPKARENFIHAHLRCMAGLSMSAMGIKANKNTIKKFEEELSKVADEKLQRLRYLVADKDFNPNSPKQKSELIYDILGAKLRSAKGRFVKKREDASTGATPLRAMRNDHPVFRRIANGILEAIEPAKQISNVVGLELFQHRTKPDEFRFFTSYDGVGTTTTRLSSRTSATGHGGNAQNIRHDYRIFMEADENSFLLDVDFSGADEVFVSFESRDPKKIELIRSGRDIHASNALIFFPNWTYDRIIEGKKVKDPKIVHPITGIRQITKKLVHGNNYLMAGLTLLMTAGREAIVAAAEEVGYKDAGYWSQDRLVKFCAHLEYLFRSHYVRLKRTGEDSWYSDIRKELIATRGVYTIFRYYQRFLGDPHEDDVLRAAAATYGQANTAGRINMTMEELLFGIRTLDFRDGRAPDCDDPPRRISHSSHGITLRLQTHDSLTFNVRHTHPKWRDGVRDIFHVMRRPIVCKGEEFRVGIEAEISYQWGAKDAVTLKTNTPEEIDEWLRLTPKAA